MGFVAILNFLKALSEQYKTIPEVRREQVQMGFVANFKILKSIIRTCQ